MMLYKLSDIPLSSCYCWLHPYRVSYSFLQGLGIIAQNNTKADIVEDALAPLDMVTVRLSGARTAKPNSRTRRVICCIVVASCTPVMMRGPLVRQLSWEDLLYSSDEEDLLYAYWEDLLYASYDERTSCTPVIMSHCTPVTCYCTPVDERTLYASYDERTYCTVMMRHLLYASYDIIVRQYERGQYTYDDRTLLLYASYDERTLYAS